jgi:glycine cleavage system H lipoate-binding protein
MKTSKTPTEHLYSSSGHEWIEFHNLEASVGITGFRVLGAKQVKKIEFVRIYGFKKKGAVLANIQMDNRTVQVHMPVDGHIIRINDTKQLEDDNFLLNNPEKGWLVKISVSQSCERTDLLSYEQYNSSIQ